MKSAFGKVALGSMTALGLLAAALPASASSGLETPDSGAYQVGRGSAWLARADDPLAAFFNPAGLVRQATGVHLGAHIAFLNRCYTRTGYDVDNKSATYGQPGFPVSPGTGFPGPGTAPSGLTVPPPGAVCSETEPSPNPQLAVNYRALDKLAIGLAVVAPHGVGSAIWPETLPFKKEFNGKVLDKEQPSSQRYMLVKSSSIILFPTLSVSYAVTDDFSIGAGFVWGVAVAKFDRFSEAISPPPGGATCGPMANQQCLPTDDFSRDIKAKLSATDIFIPGFVIGALYSPNKYLDVAGWFRWSDAVDTEASVETEANYWDSATGKKKEKTDAERTADTTAGSKPGDPGFNAGHIRLNIPMEAKLGVRFHYPRPTPGERPKWAQGTKKVKDAMSEDLFDVEANFTYANNSSLQAIQVGFKPGITINGTGGGTLPANADIPHNWKDVFGVRLGGEVVILPSRLAARAGFYYESKGQDERYLNVDFHLGEHVGLAAGATVRLGPVDVNVAYQHTFFGALNNNGAGQLYGLSGAAGTETTPGPGGPYRTYQPINGGKLESDMNEVALGGTIRF